MVLMATIACVMVFSTAPVRVVNNIVTKQALLSVLVVTVYVAGAAITGALVNYSFGQHR